MHRILFIFASLLSFGIVGLSTVFSQSSSAPEDQLLFFQNNLDGSTTINLIEKNATYSSVVPSDECYNVSGQNYLIATSEKEKPSSIEIVDIRTSELVGKINWMPEWSSSCIFGIVDGESLLVRPNIESGEGIFFDIDSAREKRKINLNQGRFIEGNFSSLSDQEAIYSITNGGPFKFSPDQSKDIILYHHCPEMVDFTRNEGCRESLNFRVYDLNQKREITTLQAVPYMRRDPVFDFGYSFHWSPRGNYIAYRSGDDMRGQRVIYDLKQNNYIDTSSIKAEAYKFLDLTRWSPDETKIAVLLMPHDESKGAGSSVGVFDLGTQQFEILPNLYEVNVNEWDWLPTSDALALNLGNNTLVRVDLQGSSEVIAENVDRINSTYNRP